MATETSDRKRRKLFASLVPGTLEGRVCLATAVTLLFAMIAVWIYRLFASNSVAASEVVIISWIIAELVVLVVICVALFIGIRWLRSAPASEFLDIERGWKSGEEALQDAGMTLRSSPLFLVLGSNDREVQRAIMEDTLRSPLVDGVPNRGGAQHALSWYADRQATYLFCTNVGCLSATMGSWQPIARTVTPTSAPSQGATEDRPHSRPPESLSRQTPVIESGPSRLGRSPGGQRMQASSQRFPVESSAPADESEVPRESQLAPGTILGSQVQRTGSTRPLGEPPSERGSAPNSLEDVSPLRPQREPSQPTIPHRPETAYLPPRPDAEHEPGTQLRPGSIRGKAEFELHAARLEAVCERLRRSRRPVWPVDGIVVLLPLEAVLLPEGSQTAFRTVSALAEGLRRDLLLVQESLKLRCPVTIVITGFERLQGFGGLARRIDAELINGRLGYGFPCRSRPIKERLRTHVDRVCGEIERIVYELFRPEEYLNTHRANRKLYEMLCQVRSKVRSGLTLMLTGSVATSVFPVVQGSQESSSNTGWTQESDAEQGDANSGDDSSTQENGTTSETPASASGVRETNSARRAESTGNISHNEDRSLIFSGCYFAATVPHQTSVPSCGASSTTSYWTNKSFSQSHGLLRANATLLDFGRLHGWAGRLQPPPLSVWLRRP